MNPYRNGRTERRQPNRREDKNARSKNLRTQDGRPLKRGSRLLHHSVGSFGKIEGLGRAAGRGYFAILVDSRLRPGCAGKRRQRKLRLGLEQIELLLGRPQVFVHTESTRERFERQAFGAGYPLAKIVRQQDLRRL